MRFMVMHKQDANMEAGGPPDQQIIAGMGALVQESLKNRVFTTGAGLHRSARRARLERGDAQVTKGPYTGQNELLASFAMIKASSLEEAIERARQFAKVLGDVEVEVGPVVEPWEIGVLEKPEKLPLGRFLLLCKGDRLTESGVEPSPARRAALEKLLQALRDEGVLVMSDRLAPSSRGARLAWRKRKAQLDGWAVCRVQGADRRLLGAECGEPRRRHRLGGALCGDPRQQRGGRARVRRVRLRRSA
jgi:hypothetical protein